MLIVDCAVLSTLDSYCEVTWKQRIGGKEEILNLLRHSISLVSDTYMATILADPYNFNETWQNLMTLRPLFRYTTLHYSGCSEATVCRPLSTQLTADLIPECNGEYTFYSVSNIAWKNPTLCRRNNVKEPVANSAKECCESATPSCRDWANAASTSDVFKVSGNLRYFSFFMFAGTTANFGQLNGSLLLSFIRLCLKLAKHSNIHLFDRQNS